MREVTRRRVLRSGALACSVTATGHASAQSGEGATEWPALGFNARNSGRSPAFGPTDAVTAAWSHETGGPVESAPAVASGHVYVGSDDHRLYAFEAVTGELQWTTETDGPIRSSPAVNDEMVYIGSDDESIRAVDTSDGTVIWAVATGGSVSSSPAVRDGTVYVGSEDGSLYAVGMTDGSVEWTVDTGSPVFSSPAVAGGTVYFGSADTNVYAVDAASGDVEWRFGTGDGVASSPAVVDGTVYIGSTDGSLYALANDGNQQWRVETGGLVGTSPAVAGGSVYVGNGLFGNQLYAVDAATGDIRWMIETGGAVQSAPAVADGLVYVGSGDNKIYAVEAESGEIAWTFETGDLLASSPAVVDGTVYIGSNDGRLYALTDDGIPARVGPSRLGPLDLAPVAVGALGLGGAGAWLFRRRRAGADQPQNKIEAGEDAEQGAHAADDTSGSTTDITPEHTASTPESGGRASREAAMSGPNPPAAQPTSDQFPSVPSLSVDYGHLIDRELIGSGGNADVVSATLSTADGDRTIAVKEPRTEGTLQMADAELLLSEAEVWSSIDDHDHIVSVLDYDVNPLPWIAMEYMDGGTLADRAGNLDLPEALWTALCVVKGVRHAHRRGVAHLDLKPQNVLFRSTEGLWDVPKVGDWGLSRYLLEHSNSVEGLTPQYAAPEQFDEDTPTDDITDIYQLGAVFYELFTGQPPFEGSPARIMQSVMGSDPTPPGDIADLPSDLDDLLLTALATERSERYDDIIYLRDGLQRLYESQW